MHIVFWGFANLRNLCPMEVICMNCQTLFSEENNKNISKCVLKIFTQYAKRLHSKVVTSYSVWDLQ